MAIYKGDTKISGNSKELCFPLFTPVWQDHIVNNASWLRSNTFSWQNASVYVSAYNHLVDDIDGITSETETIAGTTITFYHAADDHKIILPDQEANADAIFTATGTAWYYILDTTNQRFKMPRSLHGNIVEKYESGGKWCRVWSDGWCEQGGRFQSNDGSDTQVVFLKAFTDTNYTPIVGQMLGSNGNATYWNWSIKSLNASSMTIHNATNGTNTCIWQSCGYISNPPENSQYKYLYFYVGNNIQNETSVNVAGLAEDLNGKVDLDGSNATFKHVVETYQNGTEWYRVWSDGWCEQGGLTASVSGGQYVITTFLKPFVDANYSIVAYATGAYSALQEANSVIDKSVRQSFAISSGYFNPQQYSWYACGYIS